MLFSFLSINVFAQKTLNGLVVTSSNEEPITGAMILVKGTTNGAVTDLDGRFTIDDVKNNDILEISFIGYKPQEITVTSSTTFLKITLEDDVQELSDVVVVGFGKQKRSGVVSSINTVTAEELSMPTRNLTNNLAGQMAGVIAIQRSGEPGYDDAEFFIRGVSSFAGGTSPLVLVDGVPRSMSDVDVEEIDTFSVLKDAAATAVYGAEGANGVVLITTRRGTALEKTQIKASAQVSFSQPTRLPEFLGSVDFMDAYNDARWNEGQVAQYSPELIAKYASGEDPDLYPDTNWMDLLKSLTQTQRYNLSFRGGSQRARYFVSSAYYSESGIFKSESTEYDSNIGLDRYNLRSNIDIDVTKSTLLRVNLSGQYIETNYPGVGTSDIFQRMTITAPNLMPFVYSDGKAAGHPNPSGNRVNPYNLLMNSGYSKEWRTMLQSKVELEQKLNFISPDLVWRSAVSYDADMKFGTQRTKTITQYNMTGRDADGTPIYNTVVNGSDVLGTTNTNSANKRIYLETSLNYATVINDIHDITAMINYNQKDTQYHDNSLPYRKQNVLGRVTYSYDERYNIEANFGYTGSETFAAGHRFGFFPAVGIGYNVTNEPFLQDTKFTDIVSRLKVRASFGVTGNDNTGGDRFLYRGTMTTDASGGSLGWGQSGGLGSAGNGIVEGRFEAPTLGWEIETKRNLGIDLAVFDSMFDVTVDYFNNERTDILLQRKTVAGAAGFNQNPWQNFGVVTNKGVDASFSFNKMIGEVRLTGRGNFTYARNKIVEYDEVPQAYSWMNVTGTRIGEQNLYQAIGFYTYDDFIITGDGLNRTYELKEGVVNSQLSDGIRPGDLKYEDVNGDGIINNYDQVRGGDPDTPEIVYGFGLSANYKGFYASVFFQGTGNSSYVLSGDNPQGFFPFSWGREESSLRSIALDRWSDLGPDGTVVDPNWNALYPRLRTSTFYHNQVASTHWLRDADFLRLKNVEIGYNFNKDFLKKFNIGSARLYIQGYNIAVWDEVEMWDPEMGNTNAGMNYPLPRTFTLGLDISL